MKLRAGFGLPEKRDSVAPTLFSEKKWGRLRISNFPVLFFSPPSDANPEG